MTGGRATAERVTTGQATTGRVTARRRAAGRTTIGRRPIPRRRSLRGRWWRTSVVALIGLALLVLTAVGPARAQSGAPITAQVDRTTLSVGEQLTLTVVVSAETGDVPPPELPPLDGLEIIGRSSSSRIEIAGNRVTAQLTYTYRLRPTRTGELEIGPIVVVLDGRQHETAPITVTALPAGAPGGPGAGPTAGPTPIRPPQPTPDLGATADEGLVVEANVHPPRPYVGQQVTYRFRLYQARDLLARPSYDAPDFTGFWAGRAPEQTTYNAPLDGRTYRVTELRHVLFPTAAGEVQIGPAGLTVPGGLFRRDRALRTDPVTVEVRPLPDGAPDGFAGAVGRLAIDARLTAEAVAVDEPVTLEVTVRGRANLQALPDPVWPAMPGWRTFDGSTTTRDQIAAGELTGERVFERVLVPQQAGRAQVPPVRYPYFDPVRERYEVIETEPLTVTVSGSDGQPAAMAAPSDVTTAGAGRGVPRFAALDGGGALGAAAERLYLAGRYAEAADVVGSLLSALSSPTARSAAHYDLGAAYLAAGDLGPAVLELRRAARLTPRDPSVRAALAVARAQRAQAGAQVDRRDGLLDTVADSSRRWLVDRELLALVVALAIVVGLLVVGRAASGAGWLRSRAVTGVVGAAVVVLVVAGATGAVRRYVDWARPPAVVTAEEVTTRAGPGPTFTERRALTGGAEVIWRERRGRWVRLDVGGGAIEGWVPVSAVARVVE